jgi:hypothetical protein
VLLSLLGVFYYNEQYGGNAPGQATNPNNARFFAETGKTIGGAFRQYWETHGGLAQQGYPVSDEFREVSPTDGKEYTVQYFQRAVFEFHPEFAGTPNVVLLSLLGVFFYDRKHGGNPPPTATPPSPAASPTPTPQPTTAPPDNTGQVIFYNDQIGNAVVGRVDASGNYSDLKRALSNSKGWTHIVPLGKGRLLWYDRISGLDTVGQVATDGTYIDISSRRDLGTGWTHIVPAGNGMILYYKATGTGNTTTGTARVNDDGTITLLKVYNAFGGEWTHVAQTDNGVIVFYRRGTSSAATLRVDNDGNFVYLKTFNNWTTVWDRLVPGINGTLLQYYTINGQAVVSRFDDNGGEAVLARYPDAARGEGPLPPNFPVLTGLNNGLLFFYNDSNNSAITARMGGDGSVAIYNRYPPNSFGAWTHVVGIK